MSTAALLETADCNLWKLTFHLIKWCVQTGRLPLLAHQHGERKWRDAACRAVALAFAREPDEVLAEARAYVGRCKKP